MTDSTDPLTDATRAQARRSSLGIQAMNSSASSQEAQWALALSGGGIRSATFCLGVLQALASLPDPGQRARLDNEADVLLPPSDLPLLARFDVLSTVSGGGYIGGFFSSLFVPGRLSGQADESPQIAAVRAYNVLKEDPPGRLHAWTQFDPARPGVAPLAWLRDQGKFLGPIDRHNVFFWLATLVRNWLAAQYIVGPLVILVLTLVMLATWSLTLISPRFAHWQQMALYEAIYSGSKIWWSSTWILLPLAVGATFLPICIAYWLTATSMSDRPRYINRSVASTVAISGLISVYLSLTWTVSASRDLKWAMVAAAILLPMALGWYLLSILVIRKSGNFSVQAQQAWLTNSLGTSLGFIVFLVAFASIQTVSQTAWLWAGVSDWLMAWGAAPLLSVLLALKWGRSVTFGLVGGVLWLVTIVSLTTLVLLLTAPHGWANPKSYFESEEIIAAIVNSGTLAIAVGLVVLQGGPLAGFLNLSGLQGLYSRRITRAFVGASNVFNFMHQGPVGEVATATQGDDVSLSSLRLNPLAPLHIVNVCLNQNSEAGGRLVNEERQARPLAVTPFGLYLEDEVFPQPSDHERDPLRRPLTLGQWLGVSGAALSTGQGRATGFGAALAIGFMNTRLGLWWQASPHGAGRDGWLKRNFMTHAYFLSELWGIFRGDNERYQHLSDGGHFENMGIYELLNARRERHIRFIVACDCGCDPEYAFGDLATLTRLARIDYGLDIRVNEQAQRNPLLSNVFAHPEEFHHAHKGGSNGRCAVLLDVLGTERSADTNVRCGELVARILLIKPVAMHRGCLDVRQYQREHPSFPQEPTTDQFFGEAQWESYRELGRRSALQVFRGDGSDDYAASLWRECLNGFPS